MPSGNGSMPGGNAGDASGAAPCNSCIATRLRAMISSSEGRRISACIRVFVTSSRIGIQHQLEQAERFAAIFVQRIALAVAAQMDALPQMVERQQMVFPCLIEHAEQRRFFGAAHRRLR